jgi:ribosome-associated protein
VSPGYGARTRARRANSSPQEVPTAVTESPSPREARRPGLPPRDTPVSFDARAALEMARRVVALAEDKKASDIVLLDVGALTSLADYFVICSGSSERQLASIADGIAEGLKSDGVLPLGREGAAGAHWVLLDFGAVIVHVFAPPERDYYQLERLWADAPTLLRVQ